MSKEGSTLSKMLQMLMAFDFNHWLWFLYPIYCSTAKSLYILFFLIGTGFLQWGFRRCEDICWVKTNKSTATPGLRHDSHTLFQHSKVS
jgi:hypothetical protein